MWKALADLVKGLLLAFGIYQAGRANEKKSALAQAEAETIRLMKAREKLDAEINDDPDLVARARRVLHTNPK